MSTVQVASQTNSSDYYDEDDPQFLDALAAAVLPGDVPAGTVNNALSDEEEELEPPPATQPSLKRRRSLTPEQELMSDHEPPKNQDDTYAAATFGGFGDYMRRKRAKLQIQNKHISQDLGKSEIFKGISIYINGWTRPSVQTLRELIVTHGGIFQPYLDRKELVTHIITCSLTPAKIQEFKHMKVVRPEWLTESIEKGCLLPWRDYIYIHDDRTESTQGVKNRRQATLGATSSRSTPGQMSSSKPSSKPAPAPLYTTDPLTKEDAARVPGYASDASNVHAQRAMADPAWRSAHTAVSSDFVAGYYKNSRLHHLSTWKAELQGLVRQAQAQAEKGPGMGVANRVPAEPQPETAVSMRGAALPPRSPSKWKGKARAVDGEDRVIMHCDFDCFFVSAGLVSRPELKGKPVVVCHSQGTQGGTSSTSEIASSSYDARKFGIRNGMSLQQARKLCPGVITIPYEFERYKEYSLLFYTVLMSRADDLQAVSVDEALIDVTGRVNEMREQPQYADGAADPAKDYAEAIRDEVRAATTCEVSIGIAHNILLARLATRHAKPAGSYRIDPSTVADFLAPLDIGDLHGFGYSLKQKAQEKLGTTTLGELTTRSKSTLIDALGKSTGETLYNAVRGIDERKLESDKVRKSVSCEINYGIRFENNEQAEAFIYQMSAEVQKRLEAVDMIGNSITVKVMKRDPSAPVEPPKFLGHGLCEVFNKQARLIGPGFRATSNGKVIGQHAWRLLKSFEFDPRELRGIGIQIQKLESASAPIAVRQAFLPFRPGAVGSSKGESSKAVFRPPDPPRRLIPPAGDSVQNSDPVKPMHPSLDPPTFSQIDMSIFAELPEDVKLELQSEYKRRSESPFKRAATAEPVIHRNGSMPPKPVPGNSRNNSIFPQRANVNKQSNYKRITQQLAPRRGGGAAPLPPHKSALHAFVDKLKAAQAKKAKGVQISNSKLKELNLDPDVFFALPVRVQREQLTRARILKQKGHIPEPPAERKVLKPRKHVLPPDFVPYIAPRPKARHPQPPFLRQQGSKNGEKLYFTETDDIQRVVEQWMTACGRWKPREKDVDFLARFIIRSVDRAQATDVGVEKAVAVMKWWLVLMRRTFPATENLDEDDLKCSQRNLVGEAWWEAFRRVKADMDAIAKERFGGKLSLRSNTISRQKDCASPSQEPKFKPACPSQFSNLLKIQTPEGWGETKL